MATTAVPTDLALDRPVRSATDAGRDAFVALLLRDLHVVRKSKTEFLLRTLLQPFLFVFVFLYVFPAIGQGVGSGGGVAGESRFATILAAGVVGLVIMMQGIQAVAMPLVTEFGFTREIEDRVQAPLPVSLIAVEKVVSGAVQGLIAALCVFPIAAVVHASGVKVHLDVHWPILLTLIPLTCMMCSSLGLVFGTFFEPRTVPMMFTVAVIPMTFLGGTYYSWTSLAPVKLGSWSWLQTLVLLNPLVYVTEGFRAALTPQHHMHLYVIYPVLLGLGSLLLYRGIADFKKRVLS
jgi:ABC-2 type transport system permease protein